MDRSTQPDRHDRSLEAWDVEALGGGRARAGHETRPDEASADEASADEARERLRAQGIVPIEADEQISGLLAADELLVAVRHSISLERRKDWRDPRGGLCGDLYVTNQRLVHLARVPVEYPLSEIREAVVADGALRLLVGEGRGVEIAVGDPRLLRVEIGAAREAARRSSSQTALASDTDRGGSPPPGW